MSRTVTRAQLRRLLRGREMCETPIDDEAIPLLGPAAIDLIESVGLPLYVAGWYTVPDEIDPYDVPPNPGYLMDGRLVKISRGARIGDTKFGVILICGETGHVVCFEVDKSSLFNTSLGSFLYCVGRFWKSADKDFEDAKQAREDCAEIDPIVFRDPEGFWPVTFEYAINGLY